MDPAKVVSLLDEYNELDGEIITIQSSDPLTVYYIKKAHNNFVKMAIVEREKIVENFKKAHPEKCVRHILTELGDKKMTKDDQKKLALANRIVSVSKQVNVKVYFRIDKL